MEAAIVPRKQIPVRLGVTEEEARDAILHTSNTAPGADGITVQVLQTIWVTIQEYITKLFNLCLQEGHHPKPFRTAEVVMLEKPGKRNLTSPRAWRPISLLSCLGKGLERLVARRLSLTAIQQGVLNPQ